MISPILTKEIKDFFKSKTILIYFILLFAIITYSFYSAVDLYSKASVAAISNPLYATGFEPCPGVFTPTLGGFFIILSLIAPFLFIQSINNEKKYNTLPLLSQYPKSMGFIFSAKLISAVSIVFLSILTFLPIFFIWKIIGGHLPFKEILTLLLGYFFYGLFIIAISFFSSSLFSSSSQSSIFALSIIMFSWFIDFGKEMNISPLLRNLSEWTLTSQLKKFEDGILSLQSVFYFILLFSLFSFLAYLFFNLSLKNKLKLTLIIIFIHIFIFLLSSIVYKSYDLTESKRNSFSIAKNELLKKLPPLTIKVYLEPTDSRYKDYSNDFLRRLKLVKNDITIIFAKGRNLKKKYGIFEYSIQGKTMSTYSNSEEEIFMILQDLSGIKLKKIKDKNIYKGYPLVVKKDIKKYLIIIYLILFPLMIFFFYYKLNSSYRSKAK